MYLLAAAAESSGIEPTIIVAVITAIATALGSWLAFRGQKSQTTAEVMIEERKLLSAEWAKYRETLERQLAEALSQLKEALAVNEDLENEIDRLKGQGK